MGAIAIRYPYRAAKRTAETAKIPLPENEITNKPSIPPTNPFVIATAKRVYGGYLIPLDFRATSVPALAETTQSANMTRISLSMV